MIVTCAYPSCDEAFDDQADIQPVPKLYCSYAHKHAANRKRRGPSPKHIRSEEDRLRGIAKGDIDYAFGKIIKRSGVTAGLEGYDRAEYMDALVDALENKIDEYRSDRIRFSRGR